MRDGIFDGLQAKMDRRMMEGFVGVVYLSFDGLCMYVVSLDNSIIWQQNLDYCVSE